TAPPRSARSRRSPSATLVRSAWCDGRSQRPGGGRRSTGSGHIAAWSAARRRRRDRQVGPSDRLRDPLRLGALGVRDLLAAPEREREPATGDRRSDERRAEDEIVNEDADPPAEIVMGERVEA